MLVNCFVGNLKRFARLMGLNRTLHAKGHSTIVLTLDTYSHVLPDMQQGAADRIETLLFKTGT